jgi:tetratricopeptide (TPR) repeat protein
MRITRRIAAGLVLAVAITGAATIGPFGGRGSADDGAASAHGASLAATEGATTSAVAPVVSGDLDRTIASLQARLRAYPADGRASAALGLAYVQQARVTTDPSYYPKAEAILRRSLRDDRQNAVAFVGMASLAAARHRFDDALGWGRRAEALDPYDANAYGTIGDALVELGRYDAAFRAFQRMVDLRPSLASFARVSYARELTGDVTGAIDAMRRAARFASGPSDEAWATYQLGDLAWNRGRVDDASAAYRRAARLDRTSVPAAAGLARVAWARGDLTTAIRRYAAVVRRAPLPEYVIALGDLYRLSGDRAAAGRTDALLRAEEALFRANGVNLDLEQAIFEADHGDPRAALLAARAEWGRRHSVHVADALAWALYANGRYAEAVTYSDRALRLGTRNATFLFHAGMIRWRLGRNAVATRFLRKAIATNPWFSIEHAGEARSILARIEARS